MSIADKVRKLAALAGSDNEHEASSAALQACRLIRDGKVVIRDLNEEENDFPFPGFRVKFTNFHSSPDVMWREPPPPPKPTKPIPRGPFIHQPTVDGRECFACAEPIERGDAFECEDGYVHGDCIPKR